MKCDDCRLKYTILPRCPKWTFSYSGRRRQRPKGPHYRNGKTKTAPAMRPLPMTVSIVSHNIISATLGSVCEFFDGPLGSLCSSEVGRFEEIQNVGMRVFGGAGVVVHQQREVGSV